MSPSHHSRSYPVLILAAVLGGALTLLGRASAATTTGADTPRAQVRETSEKIQAILDNPALRGPAHADERLAQVRTVLDERFDWPRISRWVLARNLPQFNDQQFKEFTKLFSRYVVLYYMARIEHFIGPAKDGNSSVGKVQIVYGQGRLRGDGSVEVPVTFKLDNGNEIDTSYTMVKEDDSKDWKVRNFIVEGVSLVSNWRTELSAIGRRDRILQILARKVKALEKK